MATMRFRITQTGFLKRKNCRDYKDHSAVCVNKACDWLVEFVFRKWRSEFADRKSS